MPTRAELQMIMDRPGFGSGRAYLSQKEQEAEALSLLPSPDMVAPVRAGNAFDNWMICSFGNSSADGQDWYLTTDSIRASELADLHFPEDAKTDALVIAAIVNCYRMGLLVRLPTPTDVTASAARGETP